MLAEMAFLASSKYMGWMCGRFGFTIPKARAVEYFAAVQADAYEPRVNTAPTQRVAALRLEEAGRCLRALRWGLVPHWAKDASMGSRLINARSETVAEKPAFRDSFARRRCLIPAEVFYEWKREEDGSKQPYAVRLAGAEVMALGGVWSVWRGPEGEALEAPLETCAILTTRANAAMATLHDRMPVIVAPEAWDAWLDPATPMADLGPLMAPTAQTLVFRAVSKALNNPRNQPADALQHTLF